jgi:hypothetical protein
MPYSREHRVPPLKTGPIKKRPSKKTGEGGGERRKEGKERGEGKRRRKEEEGPPRP